MNKQELIAIGNRLILNYGGMVDEYKIKSMLGDWQHILKNLDYDLVNDNLNEHLSRSPYMPKLSDLTKNGINTHKSVVPGVEETLEYLKEIKRLEENAAPKEVALSSIKKIKELLGEM